MTTSPSRSWRSTPWTAGILSLIPWAAFLVALALADDGADDRPGELGRLVTAAPVYLGFVALPSFLPLAAARAWWARMVVLLVMTAVAVIAGVLVVTTDDAQAGLAVLQVPFVAVPLAALLWIGQAIAARRGPGDIPPGTAAAPSDRLAALVVDVAILGAALIVPLTALSRARHEIVAGVLGVAVATAYMTAFVAGRGRTVGLSLVGLAVVDAATGGRVPLGRALVRSLIVVLEVAVIPTFVLAVAGVAELATAAATGRSVTDTLLGTSVVTTR